MHYRFSSLLLGALLSMGACQNSASDNGPDMTVVPQDLAMAARPQKVTIRDLNTGKVPSDTLVEFTGVIIGPLAYNEVSYDKTSCDINLFIAQPDPTPTLHDGIEVMYPKTGVALPDMGLTASHCRMVTMNEPITQLVTGHAVDVIGKFVVSKSGDREVVLVRQSDVVDQGDAPAKPMPVIVDPKMFVNGTPAPFLDASGALVTFQTVSVTDINKYMDFNVTADGMNKAQIASNFMGLTTMNYMPPAVGSKLMSVTGIVFTDFGGTIWARTEADIVVMGP